MSLFDSKFSRNNFPDECHDGTVKIVGNKVICEDSDGIQRCEVNIDEVQYAYIIVDSRKQSLLFLFDHHQNSIPTNYKGFQHVYEELSKKFQFNDTLFFENVNRKVELKKEIWRRKYEPTYAVLNESFNDYDKGFEIQLPEIQFISWDMPFSELEKNETIVFEQSPFGQRIVKINFPVRIGNIILKDFSSYIDNSRSDSPVLRFYTQCFDRNGTDTSYHDLKRVLLNDVNIDENRPGYERADQQAIHFTFSGINLSICYTYDSDWQFNGGYTSLSIENNRHYPDLIIDANYEEMMEISDYLILEGKLSISEDYQRNRRVKGRQPKIIDQFEDRTVIWRDDKNTKIGFSSNEYAQVYDFDEIKSFRIQNVLPARGSGAGYLELVLNDQNYAVFSGSCNVFDTYADQIIKLTNKELIFGEVYHDC